MKFKETKPNKIGKKWIYPEKKSHVVIELFLYSLQFLLASCFDGRNCSTAA